MARAAMSCPMFCDRPATSDAATNSPKALWNSSFRPQRSDSLPHNGVETVIVSMVADATHEYWSWPPSSPTIVGSAVPTTEVKIIEVSMASMSPDMTSRISRWV